MNSDDISPRLQRYRRFVREERLAAAHGGIRLVPDSLWISITENCNFRCVGCYTEGVFKKTYVSIDDVRNMLTGSQVQFSVISLTEGEAFLHPLLCEIIEACKSIHPAAEIDLVTNASIPIRGKYRKAVSLIDRLGISIDGATKATYESIRKGGNFERFLDNVRDIVAVRTATGHPANIEFDFTAMTKNVSELPDVVRIAASVGIRDVYYQPMEMRELEIIERVGEFHITRMPIDDVYRFTDEAVSVGRQLGVRVRGAAYMTRPRTNVAHNSTEPSRREISDEEAVCTCRYLWSQPFQYVRDGSKFAILPCCYMDRSSGPKISRRYDFIFDRPQGIDIYNSASYWQMRQDLSDGLLEEFCGGCKLAHSYPWVEPLDRDD